jgi:hypothetical protein
MRRLWMSWRGAGMLMSVMRARRSGFPVALTTRVAKGSRACDWLHDSTAPLQSRPLSLSDGVVFGD